MSYEVQNKLSDYIIYTKKDPIDNKEYKLVIPSKKTTSYQMFIIMENTRDKAKSPEDTINSINEIGAVIQRGGVISIQQVNLSLMQEPDTQKCEELVSNEISSIQSHLYDAIEELEKRGISARNINFRIIIITQGPLDKELAGKIEKEYPNSIGSLSMERIKEKLKSSEDESKKNEPPKSEKTVLNGLPTDKRTSISIPINPNTLNSPPKDVQQQATTTTELSKPKTLAKTLPKASMNNYGYTYIKIVPIITIISISIFWLITFVIIKKLVIK